MNPKNKKNLSRFHPLRILHACLKDALFLAAAVLILDGVIGMLTGTKGFFDTISLTFKWAGIAFLIGCVTGLRHL